MDFLGLVIIVGLLVIIVRPAPKYLSNTTRRFPTWAHEAANTRQLGPKIVSVLTLCLVVWVLVQLAVRSVANDPHPPQPVMNPACAEAERLASHGDTNDPNYRRARDACTRAGG